MAEQRRVERVQCVIRFVGMAGSHVGTGVVPVEGAYLVDSDVDAHDGLGDSTWTLDPAEARRFDDVGDAFKFWQTRSLVRPFRDDGKPNRPLTAVSIEVIRL